MFTTLMGLSVLASIAEPYLVKVCSRQTLLSGANECNIVRSLSEGEFRFLKAPSGTCFRLCFDKLYKQGGCSVSSN